jgi:hypothetical protein
MLTKEFTDGFCHKDPAGLEVEHFSMRGSQAGVMKLVTYLLGKVDDPDWVNDVMRKRTRREKERRTEGDARGGRVHGSGGGEGRKEEMLMVLMLMRSPNVRAAKRNADPRRESEQQFARLKQHGRKKRRRFTTRHT